ncbi:MAG: HDOD domain-containing protein [Deltaproteobacteria bacterium]|nr:MAG: HDOD domain-containing protein [Deltaproteobacteria bacterium]
MNAEKTKILFVDDEKEILDGLRNLLRKRRRVWDMHFAHGPEAALERLAEARFDVVVSDVRMPGMDGVTLLEHVRSQQPEAARLLLSGHCDAQASLRAATVAHRFLAKPCDPQVLAEAVEAACSLQRSVHDPAVRAMLGRVDRLPAAPSVYMELCRRAADDDVSANELAAIVERDPGLAAKVLQLVNSSYFGLARPVASVGAAVRFLGADTLRDLAIVAQVFAPPKGTRCAVDVEELAAHALTASNIARTIDVPGADADEAATAALMHDVGLVALAHANPEAVADAAGASGHPEAERARWGTDHAALGAYVLGLWGLPTRIVEAVAYHHTPGRSHTMPTTLAVHVADQLAHLPPGEDPLSTLDLDVEALADAGLVGRLAEWEARTRDLREHLRAKAA